MAASASEALLKSPVVRVFWGVSFKKLFLQLPAVTSIEAAVSVRNIFCLFVIAGFTVYNDTLIPKVTDFACG